MALSVPSMLPEDRKSLDVPQMPAPGTRFQDGGIVWELVGVHTQREPILEPEPFAKTKLTLEFLAVDFGNHV